VAKQVLEQDLERVGQVGQVEFRAQRIETEYFVLVATHVERRAGIERISHEGASCAVQRAKTLIIPDPAHHV
jgi:hypothetical protein